MLTNAFIGAADPPTDATLTSALGAAKNVWDQLLADLAKSCGAESHEWSSYSPKRGWALRVKRKQRTIVWLSPSEGCFTVAFILGEKAMVVARELKLSAAIRTLLEKAPKYPEGTGVRFEVKQLQDLAIVKQFAAIKVAN